jgi:hypothetical protein
MIRTTLGGKLFLRSIGARLSLHRNQQDLSKTVGTLVGPPA